MQKNEALVNILCLPHCHYYKPGRNEELLCRGAMVVQRLIDSGRRPTPGEKAPGNIDNAMRERIVQMVCSACEFREHDCDFAQDRRAQPCGGIVLLSALLNAGVITVEDLR